MLRPINEIHIQVRSTEIDVNGHVNNAKYLEYLEWGREDWYEERGLDYDTLKGMGCITVVARIAANYRREAVQNDRLQIQTWLRAAGNTSLTMEQEILNQDGKRVLDAEVVIVILHPETKQKVRVPDVIRSHIHSQG